MKRLLLCFIFCLLCFSNQSASATAPGINGDLYIIENGWLTRQDPEVTDYSVVVSKSPNNEISTDFTLSPDGNFLAYDFGYDDDLYPYDDEIIDRRVFRIDSLTSNLLYEFPSSFEELGRYAFSPDGSKLAYEPVFGPNLYIIDLATGDAKTLVNTPNARFPVWEPDGNRIAFTSEGNIFTVDSRNGNLTKITNSGNAGRPVDWSPDKSRIATINFVSGYGKVSFINMDPPYTSTSFDTTNAYPTTYINDFSFSPDGTKSAFATFGSQAKLYVVDGFNAASSTREIPTTDLRSGVEWRSLHDTSNVARFWSPKNQHHFFTADPNEALQVMLDYPNDIWSYEGVAYTTPNDCTGMSPVYRFWSPKNSTHFFTINEQEKDIVINNYDDYVWSYEGVAYCASPTSQTGMKPLYRFYSNRLQGHFFTTNQVEKDFIQATYDANTWRYEGIAYYVK